MKRKRITHDEPVISREILEGAKRAVTNDTMARTTRCVVCGSDCAPNSKEELCWVCRRLKISAWRDNDQMPAQE